MREADGGAVAVQEVPDADDEGRQDHGDDDADLDVCVAGGVAGELAFFEGCFKQPGKGWAGRGPRGGVEGDVHGFEAEWPVVWCAV